jgi:hypothetical protein
MVLVGIGTDLLHKHYRPYLSDMYAYERFGAYQQVRTGMQGVACIQLVSISSAYLV